MAQNLPDVPEEGLRDAIYEIAEHEVQPELQYERTERGMDERGKRRPVPAPTSRPLGYEQLAVSGTPLNLPKIPPRANFALLGVETADVRYRDDGISPTTDIGFPFTAGERMKYDGNLEAFRVVADTATDAILNVLYYAVENP